MTDRGCVTPPFNGRNITHFAYLCRKRLYDPILPVWLSRAALHTMPTNLLSSLAALYPYNRTLISVLLAIVVASRIIKLHKGLRVNTNV